MPILRPLFLACAHALVLLGCATALAQSVAPSALPEVALLLQDRAPYYIPRAGQAPLGLVVEPLRQALEEAGLPHHFELIPALRQLLLIEDGARLVCGVGWFHNAERAAKGRFSRALYQDLPLAMLVREGHGWIAPLRMSEALEDGSASLLVKSGFSYGPAFDRLLAARAPQPPGVAGEMAVVARMLAAGRADWTPMAQEEAQWLAERQPGVRLLRFSDAPAGNRRHLYCNKAVPDEWLRRLDAALPELKRP